MYIFDPNYLKKISTLHFRKSEHFKNLELGGKKPVGLETEIVTGIVTGNEVWNEVVCLMPRVGELLAPIAAEAMEEGALGEDAGASAGDSDDSLQAPTVQLVETIDEPLTHDITGKSLCDLRCILPAEK